MITLTPTEAEYIKDAIKEGSLDIGILNGLSLSVTGDVKIHIDGWLDRLQYGDNDDTAKREKRYAKQIQRKIEAQA